MRVLQMSKNSKSGNVKLGKNIPVSTMPKNSGNTSNKNQPSNVKPTNKSTPDGSKK